MARTPIPDALAMKSLKYGNHTDAERDAVAERLREAGRRSEALLLFQGRPDHPFLAEERRWAIEEGAAFHLLSLRRMGAAVSDDDLRVCARSAEGRGRWMDARLCHAALGDDEGLRRVAPHVPEGLRPEEEVEESEEEPT